MIKHTKAEWEEIIKHLEKTFCGISIDHLNYAFVVQMAKNKDWLIAPKEDILKCMENLMDYHDKFSRESYAGKISFEDFRNIYNRIKEEL